MSLPFPTLFKFYEGLDTSLFTPLTSVNLNKATAEMLSNVNHILDITNNQGSWLNLTDTPAVYSGSEGNLVRVNATGTALEYTTGFYTKVELDTSLGLKADLTSVYTKTELDASLSLKSDSTSVYTKAQSDVTSSLKADSTTVYTKTELDTSLGLKADVTTVYTKTELDTSLANKSNLAHTHTYASLTSKPTTVAGYGITDAYSISQVDAMITNLVSDLDRKEAVATFADLDIAYPSAQKGWTAFVLNENKMYYFDSVSWIFLSGGDIPVATTGADGLMSAADKTTLTNIPSIYATLSGTYSKSFLDTALSNKSGISHTHTYSSITGKPTTVAGFGITNAYTKSQVDTSLGLKADSSAVYTKTELDASLNLKANSTSVYTRIQIDTSLGLKADTTSVYTRSEVDSALSSKSNTSHTHTYASLTSKPTTVAGYGITNAYTKSEIDASYGNLNNTSDANKPISTATATELAKKPNTSSGVTITGPWGFNNTQIGFTNRPIKTFLSPADWAKPMGYSCMVGVASTGRPAGIVDHGYFQVLASRDTGGGYAALFVEHNTQNLWVGYTSTSASYPTWTRVHNANDFSPTDFLGVGAKAADTHLLDGFNSHAGAVGDTIALRDSAGDLYVRYLRSEFLYHSHGQSTRNTDTHFYSSTDNFLRKNTAAGFKTSLGLNNVNNTTDTSKPISTATQTALNGKSGTSHTHTFSSVTSKPTTISGYGITNSYTKLEVDASIATVVTGIDHKEPVTNFSNLATTYPTPDTGWTAYVTSEAKLYTYNGSTWVVTGDGTVPLASGAVAGKMAASDFTKLSGIASSANNYSHPTSAGNKHIPTSGASGNFLKYSASGTAVWSNLNKSDVSLSDVDNTSDANKPVSSAVQTALNSKESGSRVIVTASHTALPDQSIAVNSPLAPVTVTAPSTPTEGTYFYVGDVGNNANINVVKVDFVAESFNLDSGETYVEADHRYYHIDIALFGTGFLFVGGTWRRFK